jgi:hypothetical protein
MVIIRKYLQESRIKKMNWTRIRQIMVGETGRGENTSEDFCWVTVQMMVCCYGKAERTAGGENQVVCICLKGS